MPNKVRSIKYRYDSENYRNFLCKYCEKDFFNRHDAYSHFSHEHCRGVRPYQCEKFHGNKRFRDLNKKSKEQ